jgi:hypothetical protein
MTHTLRLLATIGCLASLIALPRPVLAQDGPTYIPGEWYRMPIYFGPATGPRRGPEGITFDNKDAPKSTSISVSFLSRREQLQKLLPPGFTVGAEPVVTVTATYYTEIPWLAGRGYNTLGVSIPVVFKGTRDRATGSFLFVLWENLTDPILTGREELGFAKVYAELPTPRVFDGGTTVTASWLGFTFLDLSVTGAKPVVAAAPAQSAAPAPASGNGGGARRDPAELRGQMHYKYIPRTGEWDKADASYAVITPAGGSNARTLEMSRGEGKVSFHRARWEDMPTQYTIVNAFADLEVVEFRGATISKSVGGKDLSDQRIIR